MRVAQRMSQFICSVLLLLTCSAASAQNEEPRVRNIVLVHGAWADGSGWKGVYDILVKDGYNVSIVQEPETSFQEDVAATKRVLAQQDGPCILVAHSYGGAVITEAGTHPSVVGLVYIAAHMPDAGESEAEDGKRAGCWWRERTELSTPISNGGMPREPKATRSKSQAPATRSMSPGPRKL